MLVMIKLNEFSLNIWPADNYVFTLYALVFGIEQQYKYQLAIGANTPTIYTVSILDARHTRT